MAGGPGAIIFDFDGVIADDEPIHMRAFQETLAEERIALTTADYYAHYLGFDDHDAIAHALRVCGRPVTEARVSGLMADKARRFRALVEKDVRVFPGVPAFVRGAAARVPLAIASGALRSEIELILDRLGLRDAFTAVVSADDVREGKPAPEAFLTALARLAVPGLAATQCLVIEDSLAGIEGARRARMRCVAVTNSYAAAELHGADLVVGSLGEVQWDQIAALF